MIEIIRTVLEIIMFLINKIKELADMINSIKETKAVLVTDCMIPDKTYETILKIMNNEGDARWKFFKGVRSKNLKMSDIRGVERYKIDFKGKKDKWRNRNMILLTSDKQETVNNIKRMERQGAKNWKIIEINKKEVMKNIEIVERTNLANCNIIISDIDITDTIELKEVINNQSLTTLSNYIGTKYSKNKNIMKDMEKDESGKRKDTLVLTGKEKIYSSQIILWALARKLVTEKSIIISTLDEAAIFTRKEKERLMKYKHLRNATGHGMTIAEYMLE